MTTFGDREHLCVTAFLARLLSIMPGTSSIDGNMSGASLLKVKVRHRDWLPKNTTEFRNHIVHAYLLQNCCLPQVIKWWFEKPTWVSFATSCFCQLDNTFPFKMLTKLCGFPRTDFPYSVPDTLSCQFGVALQSAGLLVSSNGRATTPNNYWSQVQSPDHVFFFFPKLQSSKIPYGFLKALCCRLADDSFFLSQNFLHIVNFHIICHLRCPCALNCLFCLVQRTALLSVRCEGRATPLERYWSLIQSLEQDKFFFTVKLSFRETCMRFVHSFVLLLGGWHFLFHEISEHSCREKH